MIVIDCEQGSPQWVEARLGIPTASNFHRILTTAKRQYSAARHAYIAELLAEWAIGRPCDGGGSPWTERGTGLEAEALSAYELAAADDRDGAVSRVGFCARDDHALGCSPDFLVGGTGGGEIKVPSAKVHVGYLLDPASLVEDYYHQIQGNLYVTRRAWWDVLSYSPALPMVLRRVLPDGDYLLALDDAMRRFLAELEESRARLVERGVTGALDRRALAAESEKASEQKWADAMFGPPGTPGTPLALRPGESDDYDFSGIPF